MSEQGRPILLTGAAGQVGWELQRSLAPIGCVLAFDRTQLDLSDAEGIRALVREVQPALIVNAAAYTAVDRAESERELAFAVNAEAPGVLAEEAARLGAPIVHYSTDYVYDGSASRPYLESDPTNPVSVYGASKLEGDCRVMSSGAAHVILRTSWVYASRGRNFLRTMLRLARERDTLRVVSDQIGTPTSARLIAEVTAQIVSRFVMRDRVEIPESLRGVYHLTARGATSWHGFASAILAGDPAPSEHRCHDVTAIASSEYPTAARRPAYSVLATDRIESTFGFRLPDWDQALALVLLELSAER